MSIRKAVSWLFDVGDDREVEALKAAHARAQRRDKRPRESVEVHLYGEAEAIRVLYQAAFLEQSRPKPPRPKRRRGSWIARYLDSLTSSLADPLGTKA